MYVCVCSLSADPRGYTVQKLWRGEKKQGCGRTDIEQGESRTCCGCSRAVRSPPPSFNLIPSLRSVRLGCRCELTQGERFRIQGLERKLVNCCQRYQSSDRARLHFACFLSVLLQELRSLLDPGGRHCGTNTDSGSS